MEASNIAVVPPIWKLGFVAQRTLQIAYLFSSTPNLNRLGAFIVVISFVEPAPE
jgi:hypothetical protein